MKIKTISFLFVFLLLCGPVFALSDTGDIPSMLAKEVSNGTELHLFPFLPAVPLPAGITVHFFMLLLSSGLILAFFFYGRFAASLKPKGLLVALEGLIFFVQDDIVFPIMGKQRGEKWLPFFCTLFIFLLVVNLIGLIPAFKTATGNINVTTALAAIILVLIFVVGIKNLGPFGFVKNFYPSGVAAPIGLFVMFLEFIGVFIRTIVLSLRLFANMFAGHMAILSFLMLLFVLNPATGAFAVPFAVFTYLLEVLIGLIQALVFTLLGCIFITMASSAHECQ